MGKFDSFVLRVIVSFLCNDIKICKRFEESTLQVIANQIGLDMTNSDEIRPKNNYEMSIDLQYYSIEKLIRKQGGVKR